MASEIRVNKIENRSGLGTVTFADTGVDLAGIVTATTFSGSGASLTNIPDSALSAVTASKLTGALPAISGANLTGIAATDNVRTGILDVAGISTFRNTVNIGAAVTISESGIEASGIGITVANINGEQIGGRRNIIINGAMNVAQRATSVSVSDSATGFKTVDRFEYNRHGTITNVMTMAQSSESPDGFSSSLKFSTTTADASLTGSQSNYVNTELEGQDLQQLAYGTSSAKSFTLSFYVKGTITGTYVVWFYSIDTGKACTKTYTISSANTWERKTITVAGDTSSAIDNDNGSGLMIRWILGAGPDYSSGSASTTWSTDGYTSANRYAGQTANIAATTSDNWAITGVQMELGSQATAFEHRSFVEELTLCQRYYFQGDGQDLGASLNNYYGAEYGSGSMIKVSFPTTLRAKPTVTAPSAHSGGGSFDTVYENFTEINYYITGDTSVSIDPSQVKVSAEL